MSLDKQRYEAARWLETAQEDLESACILLEKGKFSHACFLAQQCAEKAVKALWYWDGEDPWGHSVQKLLQELPNEALRARTRHLLEAAAELDRFYVPTRYPNGLPDLTPGKCFFQKDADEAVRTARRLLDEVKACMGSPSL